MPRTRNALTEPFDELLTVSATVPAVVAPTPRQTICEPAPVAALTVTTSDHTAPSPETAVTTLPVAPADKHTYTTSPGWGVAATVTAGPVPVDPLVPCAVSMTLTAMSARAGGRDGHGQVRAGHGRADLV